MHFWLHWLEITNCGGDWIMELGQTPTRKTSGSRALPEVSRMVKRAKVKPSFARCEGPIRTESHRQDALVLRQIAAGRTQARRLAERHRLPVERCLDTRVSHVNRKTEAGRREQVVDH